jgi:hypothetical protein
MKSCLPDDIPFGAIVSLVNRSQFVVLNDRLRPRGLSREEGLLFRGLMHQVAENSFLILKKDGDLRR